MNTLPPEPEPILVAPPSAFQRVIAAYQRIAETEAGHWSTLRSEEDVLVEAKAIDERIRAGESLPLAGQLLATTPDFAVAGLSAGDGTCEVSAPAVRRLTQAGAVVLGHAPAPQEVVRLKVIDVALGTGGLPASGVFGLRATGGLVPFPGGRPLVFARSLATARLAVTAATGVEPGLPGSCGWPGRFRLSAGEHPRIAIPRTSELDRLPVAERAAFDALVTAVSASGGLIGSLRGPVLAGFDGFDLLMAPASMRMGAGAQPLVTVPLGHVAGRAFGVSLVAAEFADQLPVDLASLLTAEPAGPPLAASSVEFAVFGEQVRGRPVNKLLVELGARFEGPVLTAERYRLVLLDGPEAGVLPGAAALAGERWTLSPGAFETFHRSLAGPLKMAPVELDDRSLVPAVLCDPSAAADARELSGYQDWRAFLRFATTTRQL